MYNFIITQSFLNNQKEYIKSISKKEIEKYNEIKKRFQINIFDPLLNTHEIYEKNWVKVFSSYINKVDRIIFFYKNPQTIYLYKIMTNHDYNKLLWNIKNVLNIFLEKF